MIDVVTVAWGPHLETLKHTLPTWGLDRKYNLRIFTTSDDEFPGEKIKIDVLHGDNAHDTVTKYHLQAGSEAKGPVAFICPDMVLSDGTLDAALRRIEEGYSGVFLTGIRTSLEDILPFICRMPSRPLVKMAMNHLHHSTYEQFWQEIDFTLAPSNLYWWGDGGILARGFHLHPLMVIPPVDPRVKDTIDGDYVAQIGGNCYVMADSDEGCAIELSPKSRNLGAARRRHAEKPEFVRDWVKKSTNWRHKEFFKQTIRFHHGDLTKWPDLEAHVQAVCEELCP